MNKIDRIIKFIEELENQPKWKKIGRWGKNIAAVILAGLPYPGVGSVSLMVDKVGGRFFEPDLKQKIIELAKIVESLTSRIDQIDSSQDQIIALFHLLKKNPETLSKLNEICKEFNQGVSQKFQVYTENSLQEFIDITVKDMDVKIEAHDGGVNILHKFKTERGNTSFVSTDSSYQRISKSEFSGKKGGKISMDKLKISGPLSTFDNETETGIHLRPGGSIVFKRRGKLSCSKRKEK